MSAAGPTTASAGCAACAGCRPGSADAARPGRPWDMAPAGGSRGRGLGARLIGTGSQSIALTIGPDLRACRGACDILALWVASNPRKQDEKATETPGMWRAAHEPAGAGGLRPG